MNWQNHVDRNADITLSCAAVGNRSVQFSFCLSYFILQNVSYWLIYYDHKTQISSAEKVVKGKFLFFLLFFF